VVEAIARAREASMPLIHDIRLQWLSFVDSEYYTKKYQGEFEELMSTFGALLGMKGDDVKFYCRMPVKRDPRKYGFDQ